MIDKNYHLFVLKKDQDVCFQVSLFKVFKIAEVKDFEETKISIKNYAKFIFY